MRQKKGFDRQQKSLKRRVAILEALWHRVTVTQWNGRNGHVGNGIAHHDDMDARQGGEHGRIAASNARFVLLEAENARLRAEVERLNTLLGNHPDG